MKTTAGVLSIFGGLLVPSALPSFAIDGLEIARQETNIVISWPSQGDEHYLIQFRPTLDASTPWTTLTNNYAANSTNRTTFTIFGVIRIGAYLRWTNRMGVGSQRYIGEFAR